MGAGYRVILSARPGGDGRPGGRAGSQMVDGLGLRRLVGGTVAAVAPSADQYFSARPTAASKPRTLTLELGDLPGPLRLRTDSAVFSATEIDAGTRFLLSDGARPDPATTGVLVDVGCGYGPIALTLALRAPGATIWAVDVNERARALCAQNARTAGVADRVRVVSPDEVPDDLEVDGIWSNPPVRVGKAALHALLEGWLPRLGPGAQAHLVVARNLGADSLARWLTDRGAEVVRRGSRRGYRLLDVTPAPAPAQ